MQFPSKLYSYNESVISKFNLILLALENKPMSVSDLFLSVRNRVKDVNEYIDALDCLYSLGVIDYDKDREVLYYVN